MTSFAPIPPSGNLKNTAPESVLQFCQAVRFCGTLAFTSPRGRGVLPMLNGAPEIAPGALSLERAFDTFASLEEGTYTLTQLVPPLEGAVSDGDLGLRGTFDKLTFGELLRYCEACGLTGTVLARGEGGTCSAVFSRGELSSATLDGVDDLAVVLRWNRGGFSLQARNAFHAPERTSASPDEGLLKTLEVALSDLLEKNEAAGERNSKEATRESTVDKEKEKEKPKRKRTPSIARDLTLPFGIEAVSDDVAPPPPSALRWSMRPPAMPEHKPGNTVKVYVVSTKTAEAALEKKTEEAKKKASTPDTTADPTPAGGTSGRITKVLDVPPAAATLADRVLGKPGTPSPSASIVLWAVLLVCGFLGLWALMGLAR